MLVLPGPSIPIDTIDAIAVLDAVGSERATIFAPGFASMTGLVLRGRSSRAGQ